MVSVLSDPLKDSGSGMVMLRSWTNGGFYGPSYGFPDLLSGLNYEHASRRISTRRKSTSLEDRTVGHKDYIR